MYAPLTVSVGASAGAGEDLTLESASAAVASLPLSLTWSPVGRQPDLVEVLGTRGWARRAAEELQTGARGVIVSTPTDDDPAAIEGLATLADSLQRPTILSDQFAGNPLVSLLCIEVADIWTAMDSVSLFIATKNRTLAEASLSCLRVLRSLGAAEISIGSSETSEMAASLNGWVIIGGNDLVMNILVTHTAAREPHLTVSSYGAATTLEIDIPDSKSAKPANAVLSNLTGSREWPALYEDSHRNGWKRAIQAVSGGGGGRGDELREFAADIRTVHSIFTTSGESKPTAW